MYENKKLCDLDTSNYGLFYSMYFEGFDDCITSEDENLNENLNEQANDDCHLMMNLKNVLNMDHLNMDHEEELDEEELDEDNILNLI